MITEKDEPSGMKIGAVAEDLGIKIPTLRVWCDNGLIETYRGDRNARYIYGSEKDKIVKLKEIMNRYPKPTYAEAKVELMKENLWQDHQKEEASNEMSDALSSALENQGVLDSFQLVAQAMNTMKNETASKQDLEVFKDELLTAIETESRAPKLEEESFNQDKWNKQQQETQKDMRRILKEMEQQKDAIVAEKEQENDELKKEINLMKDKLDKAVDYIQNDAQQTREQKTFWQRVFGKK